MNKREQSIAKAIKKLTKAESVKVSIADMAIMMDGIKFPIPGYLIAGCRTNKDIAEYAADYYKKALPCMNYDDIKKLIFITLYKAGNEPGDVSQEVFPNITAVPKILIKEGRDLHIESAIINKPLVKKWGKDVKTVINEAINNTKYLMGEKTSSIMDVLSQYDIPAEAVIADSIMPPMTIVTNKYGMYGAACIFNKELFRNIAKDVGDDLVIIPSSIHELIAIPLNYCESVDNIATMISDINATVVAEEECLSDSPFIYSSATDDITVYSR